MCSSDLVPENSDHGRNLGVELEARTSLGRLTPALRRFSVNANASVISSKLTLKKQITRTGSTEHPLQGQAAYLLNTALSYAIVENRADLSLLFSASGKRLRSLGMYPLPDMYEQPFQTFDGALSLAPRKGVRMKLGFKNLFDGERQVLQAGKEVSGYRSGRSYSFALSWGS